MARRVHGAAIAGCAACIRSFARSMQRDVHGPQTAQVRNKAYIRFVCTANARGLIIGDSAVSARRISPCHAITAYRNTARAARSGDSRTSLHNHARPTHRPTEMRSHCAHSKRNMLRRMLTALSFSPSLAWSENTMWRHRRAWHSQRMAGRAPVTCHVAAPRELHGVALRTRCAVAGAPCIADDIEAFRHTWVPHGAPHQ